MTKLQTLSGRTFDLLHPTPEMIDPEEICVVLSRIPRFGGHTVGGMYSVAQHSILVESLVGDPDLKLAALLHDAHEVYNGFGDVISPAKRIEGSLTERIERVNARIDYAIIERFGLRHGTFQYNEVKLADYRALATERRDVLANAIDPTIWGPLPTPAADRIVIMSSRQAEDALRRRLKELWDQP